MKKSIKQILAELVRYGIVGVIATLLHYGIYLLLKRYINVSVAYAIGYVCSFCINYVLTNYFTFQTKPTPRNGIGFVLSHLINFSLHLMLLNLFIWIGVSAKFAPIPVFAITIPVNFLILRRFFSHKE